GEPGAVAAAQRPIAKGDVTEPLAANSDATVAVVPGAFVPLGVAPAKHLVPDVPEGRLGFVVPTCVLRSPSPLRHFASPHMPRLLSVVSRRIKVIHNVLHYRARDWGVNSRRRFSRPRSLPGSAPWSARMNRSSRYSRHTRQTARRRPVARS